MKTYMIKYRDEDPGCPVFRTLVQAYDEEHALEVFLDAPDGEGWVVESIVRYETSREAARRLSRRYGL